MKKMTMFEGKRVAFYIRNGGAAFSEGKNDLLARPYAEPGSVEYQQYSPLHQAICCRMSELRMAALTHRQHQLLRFIHGQAEKDGTDAHGGIRDMLTDLRHVARFMGENWSNLLQGAADVFHEERTLA